MKLEKARSIAGWMSDRELNFLAKEALKHNNIVEAGCYQGRSTRAMADNSSAIIHCIDPWDGKTQRFNNIVHRNGDNVTFNQFICNLSPYIQSGRIIPYISTFDKIRVDKPDFVFIDALHDYDSVKADIKHALTFLTSGLLAGHDYQTGWPGVIEAVNEHFGNSFHTEDSIWYVQI